MSTRPDEPRNRSRIVPGLLSAAVLTGAAIWLALAAWRAWGLEQAALQSQMAMQAELLRVEAESSALRQAFASINPPTCAAGEKLVGP